MLLEHYTPDPDWVLDRDRLYAQTSDNYKPNGFWLSVDKDWRRWLEAEQWGHEHWVHPTELALTDGHNVLIIDTMEKLDEFHDRFNVPDKIAIMQRFHMINWGRVAELFDGILITPYQWEARYKYHWYYGWDCASGCIWDLEAINYATVSQQDGQGTAEAGLRGA